MPNYRALMNMPADGGDLVLAIQRESGRRKFADLWGIDDDLPARDPALVAFETGEHAPPEMREKPAPTKSDKQRRRESEQAACEAWLSRACPSGDAESVHNQWLRSDDYADWLDANPEPAASEPAKRGGWVMHGGGPRIAEAKWVKQCGTWPPARNIPREATDDEWLWTNPGSVLCVIAYSTDEQCPEWTGEAAQ